MPTMKNVKTIDEYISLYPEKVQHILKKIRTVVNQAAPQATEAISYGLPTLKFHGNLVHYGAYEHHIGFYPAPSGIEAFKKELAQYQRGKGTLQFPLDGPIPYDLIERVVKFRVQQNLEKKA